MDSSEAEMDLEAAEREPPKEPAEGEAAATAATSIWSIWSAEFDDWQKKMATPLTSEEIRRREEENEELLHGTWERFRDNWFYGNFPFDAVSEIPCMRFTDVDLEDPHYAYAYPRPRDTMQIVSVQIKALTGGLRWPLDVYGFIYVRDVLDRKRIMLYNREREDCQSINEQDSYLTLTGPTRGVVVNVSPSYLESVIKVKGLTQSEDKDLSKFATTFRSWSSRDPIDYTSKLCTLEMQCYTIFHSVEATVCVRVFQGQWPTSFRGVLTASTAEESDIPISLLDFSADELPIDADGFIKLSRRVVCVKHDWRLGVSLFKHGGGEEVGDIWFSAAKSGRDTHHMYVKKFSCRLEVTVAWSLFSL